MMLWCDNCKAPVEPESHYEYEIPDPQVQGYERVQILTCPCCRQEVYQDPGTCVMCGESIAPDETLCDLCSDDILSAIGLLAENRKLDTEAVKNGITEYLER